MQSKDESRFDFTSKIRAQLSLLLQLANHSPLGAQATQEMEKSRMSRVTSTLNIYFSFFSYALMLQIKIWPFLQTVANLVPWGLNWENKTWSLCLRRVARQAVGIKDYGQVWSWSKEMLRSGELWYAQLLIWCSMEYRRRVYSLSGNNIVCGGRKEWSFWSSTCLCFVT